MITGAFFILLRVCIAAITTITTDIRGFLPLVCVSLQCHGGSVPHIRQTEESDPGLIQHLTNLQLSPLPSLLLHRPSWSPFLQGLLQQGSFSSFLPCFSPILPPSHCSPPAA